MEGMTGLWAEWADEGRPELPLPARDFLQPLPHAEGDLGPVGGDGAGGIRADLDGLVIGERQREEDAGVGQTASDDLERHVRREAGGAAERLD